MNKFAFVWTCQNTWIYMVNRLLGTGDCGLQYMIVRGLDTHNTYMHMPQIIQAQTSIIYYVYGMLQTVFHIPINFY